MQDTQPKRYQCRHIFTDGTRCGSPCLRGEDFCYYHHTTRKPVPNPTARKGRRASFALPLPEDRSAIQASIGQVLQRIATNQIDPRRAGLLLYGLQIAASILPKPQKQTKSNRNEESHYEQEQFVDEIIDHPEHGPQSFLGEVPVVAKKRRRDHVTPERELNQESGQNDRRREAIPWRNLRARGDDEEQWTRVEADQLKNAVGKESAPCRVDESQYGSPPQPSDHRFRCRKRG